MHWAQVYGLPCVSLRLFNVYGPRSRTSGTYGAVFGVFLAQKLAGKPFTVVGDGTQTRDFTFVSDVAEAFVTRRASRACLGEIMNVGSGNTYSVNGWSSCSAATRSTCRSGRASPTAPSPTRQDRADARLGARA